MNLTFTNINETTLSVNISVMDDDFVEHPEVIYLHLVKLATDVAILLMTDTLKIEITDNDCKGRFTKV